ncbi:MAG: nucleotidyltransferase family protein [Haliscomenobacter sp.]|nr:nucleotidyltransferase family protein [Haliscomenobacter sp.]MBK7477370.1 nucleotidyltransferase family protein [Haliscomenobacter sp.]MBK8880097.1 nucleotidyltransferase family protein [Haliscomenobacter sp.]
MPTTAQTLDKAAILAILRAYPEELRGYGVRRLGLFGSFVREEAGPESDIDLLVEFETGQATFRHFMELTFFLESLFDGQSIDLVTTRGLSPYIGPRILQEVEYALT